MKKLSHKSLCMKVLWIWAFLSLALVSFTGLTAHAETRKLAGPPVPQNTVRTQELVIVTGTGTSKKGDSKDGEHVFDVEIARTPQEQSYGLMNRTSMPKDHGMLFIFRDEVERAFWMKNTLIPLDMLFIRHDGVIHHIHGSAIPNDLTPIYSKGPAMAVLELNGGRAADLGIKPGDRVIHKYFQNR